MAGLVVFDLDGTLVDSSQDLADAANAMLGTYGLPPIPVDAVVDMVGDGARELVRRLLFATSVDAQLDDALARFLSLYDARLLATTRPYPGTTEMLGELASRARLAVLTNKPERATRRLLAGLNLETYFADVIGGDGDLPRKPDPTSLLHLVTRAGVSSADTLMVGDSSTDLRAAAGAAVPACVARYGFGYRKLSDDERALAAYVIDEPRELVNIVTASA